MKKIVILFGGKSPEHDVSIQSAKSIFEHIDRSKYQLQLIYIDRNGIFYQVKNVDCLRGRKLRSFQFLKRCDLVFPILHGVNYEDGKLQGFLETLGVRYVGCHLLSSALCMDKVFTKKILDSLGIPNAKYIYFYKSHYDLENLKKQIKSKIGYPCFVKPANSGSSIGISKVDSEVFLEEKIALACKYDNKILIEEAIMGREVEIGVLGGIHPILSEIGEIKEIGNEFYDYEAKYQNKNLVLEIPADLEEGVQKNIKKFAKAAFLGLECSIISRVDFLIKGSKVYLNEVNTFPGFTNVSMYPKLFENKGISYKELIDMIIKLSLK